MIENVIEVGLLMKRQNVYNIFLSFTGPFNEEALNKFSLDVHIYEYTPLENLKLFK